VAGRRLEVELIAQALCARHAHAEPAGSRIAILHGQFDIGNARSLVFKYETKSTLARRRDRFNACSAAAAMVDSIARDLARRCDKLGLIDQAEADGGRSVADLLTHLDHVFGRAHLERASALHVHRYLPRTGP